MMTDSNGESKTTQARTTASRAKRKSAASTSNIASRTAEPSNEVTASSEPVNEETVSVDLAREAAAAAESAAADEHAPQLESAAAAIRKGASDARTAARKFWPTLGRATSAVAYSSCYYVSYGMVYSATVLCEVFPKNNPIANGFADGARAARNARAVNKEVAEKGLEIATEAAL